MNENLYLDVTALPIGIEVGQGLMTTLFKRNIRIPMSRTHPYTTSSDNLSAATFQVIMLL